MDDKTFCYWLQGFVELQDSDSISDKQWFIIKDHLKLVFDKVTPVRTPDRGVTISAPEIKIGSIPNIDWDKYKTFVSPYNATC